MCLSIMRQDSFIRVIPSMQLAKFEIAFAALNSAVNVDGLVATDTQVEIITA